MVYMVGSVLMTWNETFFTDYKRGPLKSMSEIEIEIGTSFLTEVSELYP